MYEFVVLSSDNLKLRGAYEHNSILLTWEDGNQGLTATYEIERYAGMDGYKPIGTVPNASGNAGPFSFTDHDPLYGSNKYRIKATGKSGQVYYSGVVTVTAKGSGLQSIYLAGNSPGQGGATLVINSDISCQADVLLYSVSGQRLWDKNIRLGNGPNTIGLPVTNAQPGSIQVVFVLINGRVAYSQKFMF